MVKLLRNIATGSKGEMFEIAGRSHCLFEVLFWINQPLNRLPLLISKKGNEDTFKFIDTKDSHKSLDMTLSPCP
jgi:hypothetical protein